MPSGAGVPADVVPFHVALPDVLVTGVLRITEDPDVIERVPVTSSETHHESDAVSATPSPFGENASPGLPGEFVAVTASSPVGGSGAVEPNVWRSSWVSSGRVPS